MKVIWTNESLKRLIQIEDYISNDSPQRAIKFIDRIIKRGESLTQYPYKGRMVPELSVSKIREILENNYRIVYRITKDRIDKVKGVKYSKGFYAPQFLSDINKMVWKATKVYIVLFDDTVRTIGDLEPYIKIINGDSHGNLVKNNPILFVVNDVEPVVLQTLINNRTPKNIDIYMYIFTIIKHFSSQHCLLLSAVFPDDAHLIKIIYLLLLVSQM